MSIFSLLPQSAWSPLPTKINILLKEHSIYFPQEQSIYFPKIIMITSRVFSAPSGTLCVLLTHCWPASEPSNPGWFPSNLFPIHTSPPRLVERHQGVPLWQSPVNTTHCSALWASLITEAIRFLWHNCPQIHPGCSQSPSCLEQFPGKSSPSPSRQSG